uniref:Tyrosine-protein phosphatase domain-containing protein n=1 Tax=Strongyloides stercoralis TaxID=6248 RepID=A0A0K0E261_STRER
MSNQNLEVYAETIQDKKYIPDKLKDEKVSKKIEGGEVVEFNKNSLFDDSLVKCYKNIDKEIKAHYIKDISPVRTYIISDGPTFEKVDYFWELLYHEDVGVVFAILFQEHEINQDTHSKVFYWPQKKQRYGKVTVEFWEDIQSDIPFVMIKTFTMTILNKEPKKLTLFYISNWKEHDIPRSDRHLIKLYKEISQHAGTSNVLVHSSYGSGSRVFMFTYFCCILEAMKENTTIVDPLEIIKQVRSQRYGGNISSIEYAYIIKSLITYFFEYKMLVDITNHRLAFYDEYEDFILKLDGRVSSMDPNLINFLTFVNIIDHGKLKDLCDQSGYIEMPKDIDLRLQCKRFYTIANKKDIAMKKIRYIDVPCYDKSSITIRGKDSSDINSFIHANELVYKYGIENERKIIMCQGPLKETVDDMFDMIYRKKVGIVVVLISKEEMEKGEKCFPYLSTDKNEVSFGTYSLLYKGHEAGLNNFFIEYNYLIMNNTSKIKHTFKLLHYINWSDRSIPYENKSLYGLYKRITELYDNRHIAIHCSNGVGKTGTLALIIYMIDIIQSKSPFDPIKCLAKIRQHRYKAVQTTSQFVFALSILYEHFKKQIDDMDEKAYENFMSIAERIYNSNNNIRRN